MSNPPITSWDEWIEARRALLAREKQFTRQRDELNAERRRLPMVEIDKQYVFDGPDGKVSLLDLFEGRRQLIVYHFMFGPDWDEGCPGCSFLVDNIGHLSHLHSRDTTLVTVSRAPLEKLLAYQKRMDWTVPWFSSYGSDFNYDFHVTHDPAVAPVKYNYQTQTDFAADAEWPSEAHGISVFLRDGDRIFHTYGTFARGCEPMLGIYQWLDLTALGRQEAWEQPAGRSDGSSPGWRRHDQYEPVETRSH